MFYAGLGFYQRSISAKSDLHPVLKGPRAKVRQPTTMARVLAARSNPPGGVGGNAARGHPGGAEVVHRSTLGDGEATMVRRRGGNIRG